MWKGKIPAQKTANLCNQFLLLYLSKKKGQLEKLGLLNKSYVYHAAILSIKKYPLPIISAHQLKLLYGVGDLLSQELVIVIKNHYSQFLRESKQGQQRQAIEEEQKEQLHQLKHLEESSNSKSKARAITTQHCEPREDVSEDLSCRSVRSENAEREYRPRPNTLAANILIQIGRASKGEFVGEDELKKGLKSRGQLQAGKKFNTTIVNLIKNNYIQKDQIDSGCLRLTQRGAGQLVKLQNKTKLKSSQFKIQSLLASVREAKLQESQVAPKQDKGSKQKIKTCFDKRLILIIDSREVKDKQEQCFFENRLQEKHGVVCMNANLPIGDFAWMYDGQILDYIVERKKADDLLSSILDGRYKEQKFRLRNSGFTNIFYLFEGHLKGANSISERSVQTALLKTRIKDQFKVVSVKTISESVRFLNFLTASIQRKLQAEGELATMGTLGTFVQNSSKSSNITVKQIFGMSLKTIPGVGKNSVGEVLKYFGSFRQLHQQLGQLGCASQREEFLRELLKGSGAPKQLPELLVDILFDCTKN